MHEKSRTWNVKECVGIRIKELSHELADYTFCSCYGFHIDEYYWLNDSTDGGVQEYAVFKRLSDGKFRKIESYTFSWMNAEEIEASIRDVIHCKFDGVNYGIFDLDFNHGDTCRHCA